jgi:pimeloyl-ACP methyl ester carboxylesterase
VFSPPAHSLWMAEQIPNADIEVQEGASHFDAMEILPKVLAQLKADSLQGSDPSEGLGIEGPQQPALFP